MESVIRESMAIHPVRCVVLAGTVMLGLAGCATSGSSATSEWRPIPANESSLVLYAPGLGAPRVNFERKIKGIKTMEKGHWRPAAGAHPEAEIILLRFTDHAPSSMTWVREPPLVERLDRWLRTDSIEAGTRGKARNALGEVEYLRFTRNRATECVFMRQYGDTFSDQRAEESHGNIMIRGYYCLAPGERLTQRTLKRFLAGVGLKGYAVPAASRDLSLPGETSNTATEPSIQRRSVRSSAFPHAVRFTSMVFTTSTGHEIADEFDEVSLDHGRLYMYVKWRGLTTDSHIARLRVFDGAGRQVATSDYEFTPRSARWSNWWPYTIDPDVDQPGNWRFEITLDGETLVESHLVVTSSEYGSARSGTSAESRDTGFRTYQMFDDGSGYKVFVRSEGTAWAWRSGKTFYSSMNEAMRSCQDRSREVGQPALCHVYAAGDEVVWEMSEKDREQAVKAYFQ